MTRAHSSVSSMHSSMHIVRSSVNSMTRARSIMTRALVALFNSGRDDQLWEVGTHGQYVHTGHVNLGGVGR